MLKSDTLTQPKIKSSLFLQILISIHPYYYTFYWLATLAMLIYKGMAFQFLNFPYGLEVAALFPWMALESARLFLGSRGNKMEEIKPTAIYLVLTFLTTVVFIYYTVLQTYVLLFDIVIGAVAIILTCMEFFSGVRLMLNLTGPIGTLKSAARKEAKDTSSNTPASPPALPPRLSTASARGSENTPLVPSNSAQ